MVMLSGYQELPPVGASRIQAKRQILENGSKRGAPRFGLRRMLIGMGTQRAKCEANIRTRVWIPSTYVRRWAWQRVSIALVLRVETGKILDLAGQRAPPQQWPGSVRNLFSENDVESNRGAAEVNP